MLFASAPEAPAAVETAVTVVVPVVTVAAATVVDHHRAVRRHRTTALRVVDALGANVINIIVFVLQQSCTYFR